MGNKAKPTNLRVLEGNPGKRPLPKNEPKPRNSLLICPKYLQSDAIAYAEWNRIVPELYKLGLLTVADQTVMELYCSQYSIYRQALETLNADGMITNNIRQGDKANPAVSIAREAAKIIKSVAVEFGLTPSSRSRISLPSDIADDPMERLLSGTDRK